MFSFSEMVNYNFLMELVCCTVQMPLFTCGSNNLLPFSVSTIAVMAIWLFSTMALTKQSLH